MRFSLRFALAITAGFLSVGLAEAEIIPPGAVGIPGRTGGDTPLEALYSFAGHGDVVYSVSGMGESGEFNVAGIPADGIVERAYFITGIWDSTGYSMHSMDFTFAGVGYGTIEADVFDATPEEVVELASYAVDVTADVTGNGSYDFEASPQQPGTGLFGSLLVVVYSAPSAPSAAIDLAFGGESLREASSTAFFDEVAPGPGVVHIFTEADQAGFSEGEESIAFNGTTILGGMNADIFDANQGDSCSYFELPVTTIGGMNSVTVTTGEDWLGWHFAALVSPLGVTPVESTSWGRLKLDYK